MSVVTLDPERASAQAPETGPTQLGVVRYVNTRPLIAGLESLQGLSLQPRVPAELVGTLERGETHAALCSSVDFQSSELDLVVLPVGLIGCDGPTLTVQVFSRLPLERVRHLHADPDSHTSRVLAQLVLGERFGRAPTLVDGLPSLPAGDGAEAMLLIGDKALQQAPAVEAFPHRLDLGAAWRDSTGHAFTFACWMAPRPRTDAQRSRLRTLAQVLDHQRRRNHMRRDALAAREATAHGWPPEVAHRYLCQLLRFEWNARQREGLELFWTKAAAAGLLRAARPLALLEA